MSSISSNEISRIISCYHKTNSVLDTAKELSISTVKVRKVLITLGLWESDTSRLIGTILEQGLTTEQIAKKLSMSIKNVQAYMPYERGLYGGEELSLDSVRSKKYRQRMKMAASRQVIAKEKHLGQEDVGMNEKDNQLGVWKLHLELDTEYLREKDYKVLRKYGGMKQSISRDILVPSDITLHALNYAILRMFGWQNSHLHHFAFPQEVFDELTENHFATWAKLAGVYFRFPTEDYEDIYWDDDYTEGQSFKSWLKKKYTGPYKYRGWGEYYLNNQVLVKDMFMRNREVLFADVFCNELLERLPLASVLRVAGTKESDFSKVRGNLMEKLSCWNLEELFEEYGDMTFKSFKQEREYLERYDIEPVPVADQLEYRYDYGDGWKVFIRCEEMYQRDETGRWTIESQAELSDLVDSLNEVIMKHRPVCIAKDGTELLDDVGGIHGFCDMLRTIYEADLNDEEAVLEREQMMDWAEMMGWTGRKISPKQTL